MAWRCSGNKKDIRSLGRYKDSTLYLLASTNAALVDNLAAANIITKERVITAMKAIDR